MHASRLVRRLFDLPARQKVLPPVPPDVAAGATPGPGTLTLICGGSGGGKSRLLAAMKARPGVRWIEPANLPLGRACVVDCVCDALDGPAGESRVELALELLSRVGLAEAWTYLQKPHELSDGQRWRLRLALAVAHAATPRANAASGSDDGGTVLAIDEFAALLDRVTARVVARALRRLIDRGGPPALAAVVATSHDDLTAALSPDVRVVADFGVYRLERPE